MDIVKVGGSACRPEWTAALLDWLEAHSRRTPTVVVCGGGAFADTVRSEQQRLGFSDLAAHRMALLAMEQTAWWLQEAWRVRHGRLCVLETNGAPGTLWTPRALLDDQNAVPASWSITSDSLAAWLACGRPVQTLWLLKSLELAEGTDSPEEWAQRGWVDEQFPAWLSKAGCRARLLGRGGWQ